MNFKPDKIDINYINSEINNKGHEVVLNELLHWLDCARVYKDGTRPIFTTHYSYFANSWRFNYTIEDGINKGILCDKQCDYYRNKFEELERKNIEFEKENGIPEYKKGNNKTKLLKSTSKTTRKIRTKDVFDGATTQETLSSKGLTKTKADKRFDKISRMAVKFKFD